MVILLLFIPLDMMSLSVFIPLERPYFWRRWNSIWFPWPRVVLGIIFVAFWAGACASAFYTCGDLCSAGNGLPINYATLYCACDTGFVTRNSLVGRQYKYTEQKTGRYQAAQAFDILLT